MSQGHMVLLKNDILYLAHDGLKVMKAGTAELKFALAIMEMILHRHSY